MAYAQDWSNWEADEAYDEMINFLGMEEPETLEVNIRDMTVDLNKINVTVSGNTMKLSERGKSSLFEKLDLGKPDQIYPEEVRSVMQEHVNNYMKASKKSMVLKVKKNEIFAVLTDRHMEIPHADIVSMVRELGAKPLRIYANNFIMRLQVYFPKRVIDTPNGDKIALGIQLHSSEMGAAALKFDVITVNLETKSVSVLAPKTIGRFRTVHMHSAKQAALDLKREIDHALSTAEAKISEMFERMENTPFDVENVTDFIQRHRVGKKAFENLAGRLVGNKSMYETWKALCDAGSDKTYSETQQETFERAAGEFLHAIGA